MCLGTSQAYMMYKMTDSLVSAYVRKVSITYQTMPALLKRNCNGSVYQCPVVDIGNKPLFVVNVVGSPWRVVFLLSL